MKIFFSTFFDCGPLKDYGKNIQNIPDHRRKRESARLIDKLSIGVIGFKTARSVAEFQRSSLDRVGRDHQCWTYTFLTDIWIKLLARVFGDGGSD